MTAELAALISDYTKASENEEYDEFMESYGFEDAFDVVDYIILLVNKKGY